MIYEYTDLMMNDDVCVCGQLKGLRSANTEY